MTRHSRQPGGGFSRAFQSRAGSVVQFYVQATDGLGASASFPADGPNSRSLLTVNDQRASFGKVHNLRIIMTKADTDFLHAATNVMSNELLRATVLYDEEHAFYDVGVHLQGSERATDAGRVGFTPVFIRTTSFAGFKTALPSIDPGLYGRRRRDQDEICSSMPCNTPGVAGNDDDLVHLITPRSNLTGPGLLILAKYGDVFLDSQFRDGAAGAEFKLELIYYPTTTVSGNAQSPKLPQPDQVIGVDIGNLGDDPEVYRWFFLPENNRTRNDYTSVIALAKAFSKTGAASKANPAGSWILTCGCPSLSNRSGAWSMPIPSTTRTIHHLFPARRWPRTPFFGMDFNFGASAGAPLNRATATPPDHELSGQPTALPWPYARYRDDDL
jgi:hypothetical protein